MKQISLVIIFPIFLFLNVATQPVFGDDSFPFTEKHDLDAGSFRGYATLSVEGSNVQTGKLLSVDIKFFNSSGGDYFYNPFFCRLIPLPAQLALYDSGKKYVGDLVGFTGGSRIGVGSRDWISVPSLSYVGTTMRVPLPELAPGDYFLQVIYFKSYIAMNPAVTLSNPPHDEQYWLQDFYKKFDRTELFRSNPVKITVTK